MTDQKRVLILGAENLRFASPEFRVSAVAWQRISRFQNLRDFDILVLNLLSLAEPEVRNAVPWSEFFNALNVDTMVAVLRHGGRIIIIGDPRFKVVAQTAEQSRDGRPFIRPFLDWTGLVFTWDDASGETVKITTEVEVFKEILRHLFSWKYSLTKAQVSEQAYFYAALPGLRATNKIVHVQTRPLAVNRYGKYLAFVVELIVGGKETQLPYSIHVDDVIGSLLFLPPMNIDQDEMLLLALNKIIGVPLGLPEPEWLDGFLAPGQTEIDSRIANLHEQVDALLADIEVAKRQRSQVRKPLKLLYEREQPLEPVVRDVLRSLGAKVEDPPEGENKEDGWIIVEIDGQQQLGVLEVKSTRSQQFKEDGIRQAVEWRTRTIETRGERPKAIFIGNSSVDKELNERPWPFSDSFRRNAELQGVAALRAEDLYEIYALDQQGKLDRGAFWSTVYSTDGIVDLSGFLLPDKGLTGDSGPSLMP